MKPTDSADATARALDLLPNGDPAAADPRFLRDPRMVEQARQVREAAADVWLALSPIHVAPPDVLQSVLAQVAPQLPTPKPERRRLLIATAAAGWAAAAALLICLWPEQERVPSAKPSITKRSMPEHSGSTSQTAAAHTRSGSTRDARLRGEILRLRQRLDSLRDQRVSGSPRVIALRSPGASARDPEETRRKVQSILTNALRTALEAESGTASDPASLVIERGWPAGGLPVPRDGGFVRHRSFPESMWKELGLLRSEDGSYYDGTSDMVWLPDSEGRGFIGRKRNDADDLAVFHSLENDSSSRPVQRPRSLPEGFIVEDPAEQHAEVVIDQIPPPAEGRQHVIILTDSEGRTETIPMTRPDPASSEEPLIASNSARDHDPGGASTLPLGNTETTTASLSNGTLILTIPTLHGLGSFQLVERPLIANGQPDQVIVESQP